MSDYLPLLFLLVCPVAMLLMMRGSDGTDTDGGPDEPDSRITALEEEVARLRAADHEHADLGQIPGREWPGF